MSKEIKKYVSDIPEILKRSFEAIQDIGYNSIYFGHPVNTYNTELESDLINKIEEAMPLRKVYNPNMPYNQENYPFWKKNTGNGMRYFFDVILPNMESGIFLPFEDGFWGKGVAGEMEYLKNHGKPIYSITSQGLIHQIEEIDYSKVLTVPQTRERIKEAYYTKKFINSENIRK